MLWLCLLAADIESRTDPVATPFAIPREVARLSVILATGRQDVMFLLSQPGALPIASMISLTFGNVSTSVVIKTLLNVLDVVQQTLAILFLPYQQHAKARRSASSNNRRFRSEV